MVSYNSCNNNTIANTSEKINRAVETIIDIYTSSAKYTAKPLRTRKIPLQPSWWDADCNYFKQQKYSALQKFRKRNLGDDLRNYKSVKILKSFGKQLRYPNHTSATVLVIIPNGYY